MKYQEDLSKVEDWDRTLMDQIKFFVESKIDKWVASLQDFNSRLEAALNKVRK